MDYKFPKDFFFGVSNAAAQVEDGLSDPWLKLAEQDKVSCFKDVAHAKDRLRFWTNPNIEIELAQELGVDVFRMSFEWSRLVPEKNTWDQESALRYRDILLSLKSKGIKVMATLFHHSVPTWFQDTGGWSKRESVDDFSFYSKKALDAFSDLVDWWITLNEPVPWSYLTYKEGIFPPGIKGSIRSHNQSLKNMAKAHNSFYAFAHQSHPSIKIGLAHHMGWHRGRGIFNKLLAIVTDYLTHWSFIKLIGKNMDFFGINYYGAEWMTLKGPAQYPDLEYSDAGRAVSPLGLEVQSKRIHKRYPDTPIIISENGVGDDEDWVRPAYIHEHLAAIYKCINQGIQVIGYIHWTLSDNFEWSDGYGPKFGLVKVEREKNLKRTPRESFEIYKEICKQKGFTFEARNQAWEKYKSKNGLKRNYWRSDDNRSGLNSPKKRIMGINDWRHK